MISVATNLFEMVRVLNTEKNSQGKDKTEVKP